MKNKIQHFREQKNMTQSELAGKSGLSLRTIQRLEAGNIPKGFTLRTIAEALEVTPDQLKSGITESAAAEVAKTPDIDRAKLINISALSFLILPFGNIIIPAILISKTKDMETKLLGKTILSIQIIWMIILSVLMIISPFLQRMLGLQIPLFLLLLVGAIVANIFIILKNGQSLTKNSALSIALKTSIL